MRRETVFLVVVGLGFIPGRLLAADAPAVQELRVQRVAKSAWFQVRFATPDDLLKAEPTQKGVRWRADVRPLKLLPVLVPQDDRTRNTYLRATVRGPDAIVSHDGLDFVGMFQKPEEAHFLLLYPGEDKEKSVVWREIPITLNLAKAKTVEVPGEAQNRKADQVPPADDLEGQWATAQATHFAVLEALTPDFGFYPFAREATARKYKVAGPALPASRRNETPFTTGRLYELTTGATAIEESLALHRMLNTNFRDTGERTVRVEEIPGIAVAEHPWEKMMGDRKPAPEPLARFVPHDNFYVHFKNIARLIELGELTETWGDQLNRSYELTSRDYDLRQRYERQLCLRSTALGKRLGPAILRGVVITGSDGYLREGTDVSLLFDTVNPRLFLAAVEPFLAETRQVHGKALRETKDEYQGITIESFVTPLREVSLHRATVGNVVLYANSPGGLRRILDAHKGKRKALADSLDFQYMRTIFRADDATEDGFAFLSDAFIRQLVGPASRIKEKRRLEALTSLRLATQGALFTAWETGKLPDSRELLLVSTKLRPGEIYVPEGKDVVWDERRQLAHSEVYNTLHFATPLVELSLDKVTPAERTEYERFRQGYLTQWRQYFDPVGMRFRLTEKQVKVETYILPLLENSAYNWLKRWTGGGTARLDLGTMPEGTLLQYFVHLAEPARKFYSPQRKESFGDWFFVRLGDSEIYEKMFALSLRSAEGGTEAGELEREAARLALELPLTLGVRIGDEKAFQETYDQLKGLMTFAFGDYKTRELPAYKGVKITHVRAAADGFVTKNLSEGAAKGKEFLPSLYHARLEGAWYISFREDTLKQLIDHLLARKEGKKTDTVTAEVNSSLHLSPASAIRARSLAVGALEWESHTRAQDNLAAWLCLYRGGIVKETDDATAARKAAKHFLCYVPVSPDGAAYTFEAKTGETRNARHGTIRQPRHHAALDEQPLGRLLDQFRNLRADLRFREDGIHTVLTIERADGKR